MSGVAGGGYAGGIKTPRAPGDAGPGSGAKGGDIPKTVGVVMATSCGTRHGPEGVTSSSPDEFWMSTGMFPQELVVRLEHKTVLSSIKVVTAGVRDMVVEWAEGPEPKNFQKVADVSHPRPDVHGPERLTQRQSHTVRMKDQKARYIKVTILSGWDDFVVVRSVVGEGEQLTG